jgi:hypothetical protein
MNNTIVPADKKFRKQVVITLVIALPVCMGIFYGFKLYFLQFSSGPDVTLLIHRVQSMIFWIWIANGVISAWLSTRLVLWAVKTFQFNQFPPPGVRVIRDTKIKTGKSARMLGLLLIIAALIVLSTNLVLFFLHQTINDLIAQLTVH